MNIEVTVEFLLRFFKGYYKTPLFCFQFVHWLSLALFFINSFLSREQVVTALIRSLPVSGLIKWRKSLDSFDKFPLCGDLKINKFSTTVAKFTSGTKRSVACISSLILSMISEPF